MPKITRKHDLIAAVFLAAPRIWIPAYAGMTFHLCIHAPGRAFNMHNTL